MERLPGFRDFYPEPLPSEEAWSCAARQFILSHFRDCARRYGFHEYDGPPLEPLELYTLKSGEEIMGQLYNFTDKGNRTVALRPEMTPTLARMIAASERNYKKPMKWFSIPQLFRYERQQRGRMREHFQFNADIIGETDPGADAELIALLIDTLRAFGLTAQDFVVRLSSRQGWEEFFKSRSSDPNHACSFFQIIDKLERDSPEETEKKLAALGIKLGEVQEFIQKGEPTPELGLILKNLQARGLRDYVAVDFKIVRGLAYYSGTVFEAFDRKAEFRAIAGGGRYDNLIGLISGKKVNLPALGFGMGDVVLLELLKERKLLPDLKPQVDAFCLIEDEAFRTESLELIQQLRERNYSIEYSLVPSKSDKQFKKAVECGARYLVKLQANAEGEPVIHLKNLQTREDKTIGPSLDSLAAHLPEPSASTARIWQKKNGP